MEVKSYLTIVKFAFIVLPCKVIHLNRAQTSIAHKPKISSCPVEDRAARRIANPSTLPNQGPPMRRNLQGSPFWASKFAGFAFLAAFLSFAASTAHAQDSDGESTSIAQPTFGQPSSFQGPVTIPTYLTVYYHTTKPGRFVNWSLSATDASGKPVGDPITGGKTTTQVGDGSQSYSASLAPGTYVAYAWLSDVSGNILMGSQSQLPFTVYPPGTTPPSEP